eukprot:COSAG01_NODE_11373_length_1949_cov_1.701622_3_plen_202_part_00
MAAKRSSIAKETPPADDDGEDASDCDQAGWLQWQKLLDPGAEFERVRAPVPLQRCPARTRRRLLCPTNPHPAPCHNQRSPRRPESGRRALQAHTLYPSHTCVCVRARARACVRLPAQAQPLWRFAHARVRACTDMPVRCARACSCCTSVCASWHVTTAVVAACRSRRYSCSSTGYGSGLAPCSGSSAGCGLSPAPRATPRE